MTFISTVKTWDNDAIKKLNANLKLPSAAITVVRRSDGSGTSFNFTDYLAKVNADRILVPVKARIRDIAALWSSTNCASTWA